MYFRFKVIWDVTLCRVFKTVSDVSKECNAMCNGQLVETSVST